MSAILVSTLAGCGDFLAALAAEENEVVQLRVYLGTILCNRLLYPGAKEKVREKCLERLDGALTEQLRTAAQPPSRSAGTSSNGTGVTEIFTIRTKTSGKRLPTWRTDLPETLNRSGSRSILVSVIITGEDFGAPDNVPKKMSATLYAVGKKGEKETVGTRSGKIAKNGTQELEFKNVPAADSHHRVELEFVGGSLLPGLVTYGAAILGRAKTRSGTGGGHDLRAASMRASHPRAHLLARPGQGGPLVRTLTFVSDSFNVKGTTPAGKLPEWSADIPSTRVTRGGARTDVSVGLMLMKQNFSPPDTAPKELEASLFDIDKKGTRRKVATRRVDISAADAGATVEFASLSGPRDHYQVELSVSGGSASSGVLLYFASSSAPNLAARSRLALPFFKGPLRHPTIGPSRPLTSGVSR